MSLDDYDRTGFQRLRESRRIGRLHESMTDQTLLLTATVTPPPNALVLARVDPEVRMLDYLWALEFYLKLPDDVIRRIIFVENSDSDLTRLRDLAARYPSKEIEFLGFQGLDYPPTYGRGYGEFKLIDHAFDHSTTLGKLGPEARIWKGTGRYRLLNLSRMIATSPKKYDLYCDLRNRPIPWMDLRFFAFTKDGYRRHLLGFYPKLREDLDQGAPETILRKEFAERISDPMIVPRFRSQPWVDGVQGAYNINYARGYKANAKHALRAMMRRVAPKIWI
jgi:hypothetical protein